MKVYVVLYRKETSCADWNEIRLIKAFHSKEAADAMVESFNSDPSQDPENYYKDSYYGCEEIPLE